MLYPKIEDCVSIIGSKYALTIVAAKRGKDLVHKMPAHFADAKEKELTYALNEVIAGKLVANYLVS